MTECPGGEQWTGGNHWMEYFSCSLNEIFLCNWEFLSLVWFSEIREFVIFALCPPHSKYLIFPDVHFWGSEATWGNSNNFLLRCWKLYFYQPDIFSSHQSFVSGSLCDKHCVRWNPTPHQKVAGTWVSQWRDHWTPISIFFCVCARKYFFRLK